MNPAQIEPVSYLRFPRQGIAEFGETLGRGEGASHKSKVEMAKACAGKPLVRDRLTAVSGSEVRAEFRCRTPPAYCLSCCRLLAGESLAGTHARHWYGSGRFLSTLRLLDSQANSGKT